MPQFRSRLELLVAQELDAHEVKYEYERPIITRNAPPIRYLPDFTIDHAPSHLELPVWVEAKPQQFLYDLRDVLGITRRYGERFSGEVIHEMVRSEDLQQMHVEELWKPKKLAELTGESVLVVGTVGGTASLSVEMRVDSICFTREHPFVNWLGIQKAKERERKRLEWEAEVRAQRRKWELEKQRHEQEYREQHRQQIAATLQCPHIGPTKWGKPCFACNDFVQAGTGSLRKVSYTDGSNGWRVLCSNCCQDARSREHL